MPEEPKHDGRAGLPAAVSHASGCLPGCALQLIIFVGVGASISITSPLEIQFIPGVLMTLVPFVLLIRTVFADLPPRRKSGIATLQTVWLCMTALFGFLLAIGSGI